MKDIDFIENGVDYKKAWDAGYKTAIEHYNIKIEIAKAVVKKKGAELTWEDALKILEDL